MSRFLSRWHPCSTSQKAAGDLCLGKLFTFLVTCRQNRTRKVGHLCKLSHNNIRLPHSRLMRPILLAFNHQTIGCRTNSNTHATAARCLPGSCCLGNEPFRLEPSPFRLGISGTGRRSTANSVMSSAMLTALGCPSSWVACASAAETMCAGHSAGSWCPFAQHR